MQREIPEIGRKSKAGESKMNNGAALFLISIFTTV
jgi:hypothetical protein